jgi:hypothetical protein
VCCRLPNKAGNKIDAFKTLSEVDFVVVGIGIGSGIDDGGGDGDGLINDKDKCSESANRCNFSFGIIQLFVVTIQTF